MLESTLNGLTLDIVKENITKLRTIFPEIVTEDKIDFEKLQAILGEYIDNENERYNFTWHGKSKALRLAQTPSLGTLRPCKEESKDWDTTQNLYIDGDNLEVLKLLQKTYHNGIKMIYIDPPYNTGNDFIYPDDYKDNLENYLSLTGQKNEDGGRISTNSEASGRYHTNWLNMMYPRLRLARNLLTDNGVIFISIDDNEILNARRLCDEILGEENFIDTIIWKKRYGGGAKEKYLVSIHEYILVYAKNISNIDSIEIPLSEASIERYYTLKDEYYQERGPYRIHPLEAMKSFEERPNLVFSIIAPDGVEIWPKRQWRWSKPRMDEEIERGAVEFLKNRNGEWSAYSKQYLKDDEGETRTAKAFSIIDNIYTQYGTNEIVDIFGNAQIFPFPKPSKLIEKLLEISGGQDGIILDFFSGSSATAHAIMQLNARDGGNRKFIMVQLPEPCPEDTEAAKAGYKNICEIGKERIRRVGEKIEAELKEKQSDQMLLIEEDKTLVPEDLDIGFKVFKLDSSNIKKWNPDYDNLDTSLENMISNYVDGRSELDIAYEIMLKYGIDLTLPVEKYDFNGKKIYSIGFGALIICLDNEITKETADEIIKLKKELNPEMMRVVFKDNGFKDDAAKTNVKENLKQAGIEEFVTV